MGKVYRKYRSSLAFMVVACFLSLSISNFSIRADEGIALQQDENSNAISVAIATNSSGKALMTGRRVISASSYRNVGWIKQVDVTTGLGDSSFNAADSNSHNINVTTAPPDAGSIYLDLAASNKETLCTSAVWDGSNSVWWVACRALTTGNKYYINLVKVTTTGTVTAYSTTIGNGTGSNKHGYPGRQGSLLLDGGYLVLVGYSGTTVSNPVNTSTDYRPFIAKFLITEQGNGWAPKYSAEFTGTDNNSSTGAYNHRAVAVVTDGSYYYSVYTHVNNGGFRVAKYSVSNLTASSSGFFTPISIPTSPITAIPTSMAYYSNKIYLGGSIRANSSSAYYGIVVAQNTTDGSSVTTCDGDGSNIFQVSPLNDTLLNDITFSSSCTALMLTGASYNGTNYKAFTGKLNLSSSACSFDNTYGTGGVYFYAEGAHDNINTASAFDSSTSKYLVTGRQVVAASNGVFRPGAYFRTLTSCSSTSMRKYVNACSLNVSNKNLSAGGRVTPSVTFTYSDNSTSSEGLSKLACTFTGNIGEKSDDDFVGTTPSGVATSGNMTCLYNNRINCGTVTGFSVATTTTTSTSTTSTSTSTTSSTSTSTTSSTSTSTTTTTMCLGDSCYGGMGNTTTSTSTTLSPLGSSCASNGDCGEYFCMNNGSGGGTCRATGQAENDACAVNGDCSYGHSCYQNLCYVSTDSNNDGIPDAAVIPASITNVTVYPYTRNSDGASSNFTSSNTPYVSDMATSYFGYTSNMEQQPVTFEFGLSSSIVVPIRLYSNNTCTTTFDTAAASYNQYSGVFSITSANLTADVFQSIYIKFAGLTTGCTKLGDYLRKTNDTCVSDNECLNGDYCSGAGTCKQGAKGTSRTSCTALDSECNYGDWCGTDANCHSGAKPTSGSTSCPYNGFAYYCGSGQYCGGDDKCHTGYSGVQNGNCSNHGQVANGYYCDGSGNARYGSIPNADAFCSYDYDCSIGSYCAGDGKCESGSTPGEDASCTGNNQCAKNYYCAGDGKCQLNPKPSANAVCSNGEGQNNSGCQVGYYCSGANICQSGSQPTTNASCTTDAQCRWDYYCGQNAGAGYHKCHISSDTGY